MGITSHLLAAGQGWRVHDIICTAGPHDRPFEERHGSMCIAAVTEGTFQYRTTAGAAVLAPGALLLGNEGTCFECGHDHGHGDRCLSFHFAPEQWEAIVTAVPGARRSVFDLPRLPPLPKLMPLIVAAEAARDSGDGHELEELALRLAGAVSARSTVANAVRASRARATSGASRKRCGESRRTPTSRSPSPTSPGEQRQARIISCAPSSRWQA